MKCVVFCTKYSDFPYKTALTSLDDSGYNE